MGRHHDNCVSMIFFLPIYICLWGVEIGIKIAGTCGIAILAILWVILGMPLYLLIDLFGGDAKDGWNYGDSLLHMLDALWSSNIFIK